MSQGKGKRHIKSAPESSLKGRKNSRSPVAISLPTKPSKGPLEARTLPWSRPSASDLEKLGRPSPASVRERKKLLLTISSPTLGIKVKSQKA